MPQQGIFIADFGTKSLTRTMCKHTTISEWQ